MFFAAAVAVALVAVAAFRPGTRNVLPSRVASSRRRASPPSSIPDFGTDAPFPQNVYVPPPASTPRTLLPTTFADMKEMAFILAQITEHLDTDPGKAMTVASQRMGWLYARNVPQLTQMLLTEFPAFRQDDGMMRAYLFVLDFLEAVVAETSALQTKNQAALRELLAAAKTSEAAVDAAIQANTGQLTAPEFLLYLDAEIEGHAPNSPTENLLVTIKLRLLDEVGKGMGVDVMVLPKLAAESDPAELRRKTVEHLRAYDAAGCELFLQTLRLMRGEMSKRYQQVRVRVCAYLLQQTCQQTPLTLNSLVLLLLQLDPTLQANLQEVEKIAEATAKRRREDGATA